MPIQLIHSASKVSINNCMVCLRYNPVHKWPELVILRHSSLGVSLVSLYSYFPLPTPPSLIPFPYIKAGQQLGERGGSDTVPTR